MSEESDTPEVFRIQRTAEGYRAQYKCPACGAVLENPMEEVPGKTESCSQCGHENMLPAVNQLSDWEKRTLAREHELRADEHDMPRDIQLADRGGGHIPAYRGIKVCAAIVAAIGIFQLILGIIFILFGLGALAAQLSHRTGPTTTFFGSGLGVGLSFIVSGTITLAASFALSALREIAINTWHQRDALERMDQRGDTS